MGGRATGAPGAPAAGRAAGAAGRAGAAGADGAAAAGAGACAAGIAGDAGADGMDGAGALVGANGDMRGGAAGADDTGAAGADDAGGAMGAAVAAGDMAGACAGAAGGGGGVVRAGGGATGRFCGGVTADGRDGMVAGAEVRGGESTAVDVCATKPACMGCGGVGMVTGGRGGNGDATGGRWRGGVGADAVKSSSMRPRSPIAITPPHTEHRARTPASGILAGSTRNTELHSGQVTFMRWDSRVSCSDHRSETPTGEPRIGSCRRSTT